jgi:probable rRNA maturation factor
MIEIRNLTHSNINTGSLENIAKVLLQKENKAHYNLSVALVGEKRMQELNRTYRGKNHPANVLSFPMKEFGLGEVVLCPAQIRKDAKKYGILFKEELTRIFIHGLLHLVGYNHETKRDFQKMLHKEKFYARTI